MAKVDRPRVGLFTAGMESYWTGCGMDDLPAALERDALRLRRRLESVCDVVSPPLVTNEELAHRAGREFLEREVDMVLMYHATYVDDLMTIALIDAIKGIYPVLFLTQGLAGIPDSVTLTEAGTCWGVNSAVQLPGGFRRLWRDFNYGMVIGHLEDERSIQEIGEYAAAAHCVRRLKGKKVGVLPHRSADVAMFDTLPDESRLIGQTGIKITYLYIHDLTRRMKEVPDRRAEELTDDLHRLCDVVEPPREEVLLAARLALALEQMAEDNGLDALAIDTVPGLTPACGMIPCVGMARLIDQGRVVATEGDLSVAVSGLMIKELCGRPIHQWEHAMFDEGKNWILGGHEGGSAGFSMAKKGTRPKLRNTQYLNFGKTPGAPFYGVIPEFITDPGPVTLVGLFRGESGYEMRLARGQSVDTHPREVHYEHTVVQPNIPLVEYFGRIREVGISHHFALVHQDLWQELEKVAAILRMRVERLTN
jgi:L-fucose isomerase-like protein